MLMTSQVKGLEEQLWDTHAVLQKSNEVET
jgi:hypothetical protein